MYLQNFIKSGVYLPIISFFMYLIFDDIYLPVFFFLKAYTINYYYHNSHFFPIPNVYKWKHLSRLTDSGHLVSFLFYFNKNNVPLAHNIHFIINTGYYTAKILFNMVDAETCIKNSNNINTLTHKLHEITNHSLSYILIVYYMINNQKKYEFNDKSLFYTFIWLYAWLLFIYVPWVFITKDYLYSVLSPSKPLYLRLGMILFFNVLALMSNQVGKLINLF